MKNFSTNQTRNFYTAVRNRTGETSMDNVGDIALATITPEENGAAEAIAFKYRNGYGNLTRTDTIGVGNIRSINLKAAADIPLKKYTVAINSSVFDISNKKIAGTNGDAIGKTFILRTEVTNLFDFNPHNSAVYVGSVVIDSSTTADIFYKTLAVAIANALPESNGYPLFRVFVKTTEVTKGMVLTDLSGVSSISNIVLVESPQKFVLGKLSGEPCPFYVSDTVALGETDELQWATITKADSDVSGYTVISGTRQLAELEYFALGERGDVYREYWYPNNYDHSSEYLIDQSKKYKVMTIEYFWNGPSEDVQKSPRTLQIAAEISGTGSQATCILDGLYASVQVALGKSTGSGTGA